MAVQIALSNASYFLDLLAAPYRIRMASGTLGEAPLERVYAETWERGYDPLVDERTGNRTTTFLLRITGDDADTWITHVRQVSGLLRDASRYYITGGKEGDRAYYSYQPNGASNATEFDVVSVNADAVKIFEYLMQQTAPQQIDVPVTLTLRPWGRPQALVSTTSGTLNNGDDAYTLSAPAGDRPAPVRITFQSAAGDDFIRVILARRIRGNVGNFISPMECETGSFTGYAVTDVETSGNFSLSNVVNAAAHGGNVLRVTHTATGSDTLADVIQWEINDNLPDFYGKHRVFLLTTALSALQVTNVRLTYGGTNGNDITGETMSASDPAGRIVDCGTIDIPHRAGPLDATLASFKFRLQATMGNAAFTWDIDNIFLIPYDDDEQFSDLELSASASAQDQLVNDNLSLVPTNYIIDSTGDIQPEKITANADTRFTVEAGVDNLFICLMLNSATGGIDRTDDFTLKFEYFPLYEQFR